MSEGNAGYVDPDWPSPGGPDDAPIIIYGYVPSLEMGILAVILFAIAAGLHGWQVLRYRTWWFLPVFIGTVMEIVGYAFRLLSSQENPYRVTYFVVQYFFIVVAPVLFAAAIYATISILINRFGRQYSPILPPRGIVITFVICDIIATIVQVAGAALIGARESDNEDSTTANNILLGGLCFQCFSFLIFCVLFGLFCYRARNVIRQSARTVKLFIASVWVATALVYLRTVFRLAESAEGVQGEVSTNEIYFALLEFVPVVIAVYVLSIWHPGRCIPPSRVQPVDDDEKDVNNG